MSDIIIIIIFIITITIVFIIFIITIIMMIAWYSLLLFDLKRAFLFICHSFSSYPIFWFLLHLLVLVSPYSYIILCYYRTHHIDWYLPSLITDYKTFPYSSELLYYFSVLRIRLSLSLFPLFISLYHFLFQSLPVSIYFSLSLFLSLSLSPSISLCLFIWLSLSASFSLCLSHSLRLSLSVSLSLSHSVSHSLFLSLSDRKSTRLNSSHRR